MSENEKRLLHDAIDPLPRGIRTDADELVKLRLAVAEARKIMVDLTARYGWENQLNPIQCSFCRYEVHPIKQTTHAPDCPVARAERWLAANSEDES
jgi:hypothetical protein